MDGQPVGRKQKKSLTINEGVVVLCVLGLLIALAVPTYLQQRKKQSRIEKLMVPAKTLEQDGASQDALKAEPVSLLEREDASHDVNSELSTNGSNGDLMSALSEIMRLHNDEDMDPADQGPLFFLESAGMPPHACARNGRIHLIPLFNEEGRFEGIHLVATNLDHRGGPNDDGLLGSYTLFSEYRK